jgi:hypothetical protein
MMSRNPRRAYDLDGGTRGGAQSPRTEIAGLIEIITSKEPEIVEGEFHQYTDDDEGPAAGSDSPA